MMKNKTLRRSVVGILYYIRRKIRKQKITSTLVLLFFPVKLFDTGYLTRENLWHRFSFLTVMSMALLHVHIFLDVKGNSFA